MATADPALLDARIRAAEKTLAGRYGRLLVEHSIDLPGRSTIRVMDFPAMTTAVSGGTALPPILLLHDMASVMALALPLIGQLPDRRVLAVDWPGQGLSGLAAQPSGAQLRSHVVAVLESLLAEFQLTQVDLIGHGLGGQFGIYFALAHPEQLRRLVLLGAPEFALHATTPNIRMRARATPALGTALLSLSTSEPAHSRGLEHLLGRGALLGLPSEAPEIAYLISQRPDYAPGLARLTRALMTPFSVRPGVAVHPTELSRLAMPVLAIWGDTDALLTPAAGRADLDAIPGSEVVVIAGGHAPWLDDLDRVGTAVGAFLAG